MRERKLGTPLAQCAKVALTCGHGELERLHSSDRAGRHRASVGHECISEEQFAADVGMSWQMTAAELECGVIDETGEYVGDEVDRKRKKDGCRDWMRRHPAIREVWKIARHRAPLPGI